MTFLDSCQTLNINKFSNRCSVLFKLGDRIYHIQTLATFSRQLLSTTPGVQFRGSSMCWVFRHYHSTWTWGNFWTSNLAQDAKENHENSLKHHWWLEETLEEIDISYHIILHSFWVIFDTYHWYPTPHFFQLLWFSSFYWSLVRSQAASSEVASWREWYRMDTKDLSLDCLTKQQPTTKRDGFFQ